MSTEFVIEKTQRPIVEENVCRIQDVYDVKISIANSVTEKAWITLKGGESGREKAKCYIQALTDPEERSTVTIPDALMKMFGPRTKEHFNLELEYGVVISFPQLAKAVIAGSQMNVMLATSKLEDLISKHSCSAAKEKPPKVKAHRALDEFALKLGYEQEQIDMVFEKLGPKIDQNTFLKELINVSGAGVGSRVADDRWMLPSLRGAVPNQQFLRYPNNDMLSCANSPTYSTDNGVVARGIIPRSMPAKPQMQSNGRQGYLNQDYSPVGHPYNIPRTNGLPTTCGIAHGFMSPPTATDGTLTSSNIIARGFIPRTTSQTTQGCSSTYSNAEWSSGPYLGLVSEYGLSVDPQQVDQMLDQVTSRYQQLPQSNLRHIVIDGSNVAMSHGNNKFFSCKGIALCVDWFRRRGHEQITVFVPSWRKESAKMENPITDQHILYQLEEQGYLTFTPSRKVKGRRIICYDDRYLIKLAERTDGVIVSNDNFKDLAAESQKWRDVIEQRLLMYSFVNDLFMPPDDPLGRHGPNLDEFLHKGTQTHRRVCPYGRRCTYGSRCKFYHPEREDHRLAIYQSLQGLFPNQEALIMSVMKKYPQERDADKLASHILGMMT